MLLVMSINDSLLLLIHVLGCHLVCSTRVCVLGLVWIMTVFVDCLLYCTAIHSACVRACVYACVLILRCSKWRLGIKD